MVSSKNYGFLDVLYFVSNYFKYQNNNIKSASFRTKIVVLPSLGFKLNTNEISRQQRLLCDQRSRQLGHLDRTRNLVFSSQVFPFLHRPNETEINKLTAIGQRTTFRIKQRQYHIVIYKRPRNRFKLENFRLNQ